MPTPMPTCKTVQEVQAWYDNLPKVEQRRNAEIEWEDPKGNRFHLQLGKPQEMSSSPQPQPSNR